MQTRQVSRAYRVPQCPYESYAERRLISSRAFLSLQLHSRFMIKAQKKLLVLLCHRSLGGDCGLCPWHASMALLDQWAGVRQDGQSPSALDFGMTFLQTTQEECTSYPQLYLFLKRKSANVKNSVWGGRCLGVKTSNFNCIFQILKNSIHTLNTLKHLLFFFSFLVLKAEKKLKQQQKIFPHGQCSLKWPWMLERSPAGCPSGPAGPQSAKRAKVILKSQDIYQQSLLVPSPNKWYYMPLCRLFLFILVSLSNTSITSLSHLLLRDGIVFVCDHTSTQMTQKDT